MYTTNFALEQSKDVLIVPGPITSLEDLLNALNIQNPVTTDKEPVADTKEEYPILSLMKDGVNDHDEPLIQSKLDTIVFQQTLSMLEITGRIKSVDSEKWILK